MEESLFRDSQNSRSIITALSFVLAGTPAILGSVLKFGFDSSAGGLPYLLPFIIIVPAAMFIFSQSNSTARISSYIIVFHESSSRGLLWENRLKALKKNESQAQIKSFELSISWILGGAAILTTGASFLKSNLFPGGKINFSAELCSADIILILVLSILTPFMIVFLRRIAKEAAEGSSNYISEWEKLKEAS